MYNIFLWINPTVNRCTLEIVHVAYWLEIFSSGLGNLFLKELKRVRLPLTFSKKWASKHLCVVGNLILYVNPIYIARIIFISNNMLDRVQFSSDKLLHVWLFCRSKMKSYLVKIFCCFWGIFKRHVNHLGASSCCKSEAGGKHLSVPGLFPLSRTESARNRW